MAIRVSVGRSGTGGRGGALAAGVICSVLAAIAFHVVFSGSPISGGIPFLPDSINQGVGRLMFGIGGLLTTGLAIWAFADAAGIGRPATVEKEEPES